MHLRLGKTLYTVFKIENQIKWETIMVLLTLPVELSSKEEVYDYEVPKGGDSSAKFRTRLDEKGRLIK